VLGLMLNGVDVVCLGMNVMDFVCLL